MNHIKKILMCFFVIMIFKIDASQRHPTQQQKSHVLSKQTAAVAEEIDRDPQAVTQFVEEITRQKVQVLVGGSVHDHMIAFERKHADALGRYKELATIPGQIEALKKQDKERSQELQQLRAQDAAIIAELEALKKKNQTKDEEIKALMNNLARMNDAEAKRAEVVARRLRFDDCMRGAVIAAYTVGAAWLGAYLASFSSKC